MVHSSAKLTGAAEYREEVMHHRNKPGYSAYSAEIRIGCKDHVVF